MYASVLPSKYMLLVIQTVSAKYSPKPVFLQPITYSLFTHARAAAKYPYFTEDG